MARTIGRRRITVTIAAGPTATPISASNLFTTDFEIYFNTTTGYIGDSTVSTAWIPRTGNTPYNFVHGTGTLSGGDPVLGFNLANIYVNGTAGGTCVVEYMAFDAL